jgi:hypothetical protein
MIIFQATLSKLLEQNAICNKGAQYGGKYFLAKLSK